MNSKKILIPLDLVMKILELLNYWDTSSYDFTIQCEHENVVNAIMKKLQSMDLRQAYSKLIYAKDEDERFNSRIEYLKQRSEYRQFPLGDK